jgi:hypothetical protein
MRISGPPRSKRCADAAISCQGGRPTKVLDSGSPRSNIAASSSSMKMAGARSPLARAATAKSLGAQDHLVDGAILCCCENRWTTKSSGGLGLRPRSWTLQSRPWSRDFSSSWHRRSLANARSVSCARAFAPSRPAIACRVTTRTGGTDDEPAVSGHQYPTLLHQPRSDRDRKA